MPRSPTSNATPASPSTASAERSPWLSSTAWAGRGRTHPSPTSARREAVRHLGSLAGCRVAVGEQGGLAGLAEEICRQLEVAGALTLDLHQSDGATQAQEANALDASVFVGLELDPTVDGCESSYYASPTFESTGGRRLAELIQTCVPAGLGIADLGAEGRWAPVLRETRMPAVSVRIGPASVVVERAALLATLLGQALSGWISDESG